MIFGDTCDSCQIASAAASNADTNDPMAGQYQCSAAPPCAPGTTSSALQPTGMAQQTMTPSGGNASNASIWSTLTSAFTTAGQMLPKASATPAAASSSSLLVPLALVGGGILAVVLVMGKKKRA